MRCLVVDDHPLTRAGTAMALRNVDTAVEVLEAESLAQALEVLAATATVDLVLLDLELGDSKGVDTLRVVKEHVESFDRCPRVVVLSGHCEPDLVREVINLYATGFIQKATSNVIFQHAIAITMAGGVYIPEMVLRQMDAPGSARAPKGDTTNAPLTPRESEIAALLVRGLTYKRIARELGKRDGKPISDHTVRAHVGNIAWKLGVTENAKAGVMAEIARRGLVFP